jgi:beta-lactam-binding protein with PASTA domain/tRNA A-37 threonylcarbamoyl transferase component Bud32
MQRIERDTVIDERYRVLDRLGSGGMADVYCAEDTQLGRKVAVKLLYRRFAEDEEFVERFRREASSAAGLQHPNIVGVFDRGEWDGTYYIAMEYLKGQTLKQLVREHGAMPPDLAVDITIQVLRAAKFAHKRGVVHRDIKPHNVILDEEGRAKVTDFGIARAGASDMTETGSVMGTAQYLSPEQAQGQPVSPRSDLYSIGVMLYELLTGQVPFDAESPVTIALKHVSEDPVPPSQLNPAVSPALDAVVLRALEKEPANRFADADEFAAALLDARERPTVVEKRVEAYPMPAEPLVAEERERSRWWLWVLLALLLIGLAIGAYLLLAPEKKPVPDVVGNTSAVASQRLQNAGFEVNIETVQSDDVPDDRVATQDPQPGEEAKEGATVTIIVSSGPGQATVPGVAGRKQDVAENMMEEAGFKTDVRREASDSVDEGRVISTQPGENTQLQKGKTVVLIVSEGPEQVSVPDLVGDQEDDARSALADAGLKADVSEEESESEDPGTVLRQDPGSGKQVDKGTTVSIVVAKAPPEVDVPDVVDQSEDDARQVLTDAGFKVRVRRETVDTLDQDGTVIDQDPAGGEQLKQGSRVTIVVGRFEPPLNPEPTATPSETPTPEPTP